MNNEYDMQVIDNVQNTHDATDRNLFVMSTTNVRPCFAMLRGVNPTSHIDLLNACQEIESSLYLSSYLYVHNAVAGLSESVPAHTLTIARQGPSIETWTSYMDKSESGTDIVRSIHCPFWPDSAREWQSRTRKYVWPSPHDIKAIVEFGFHLVPVGHPHSDMNMMEWRISFSVAERTLVWSFNHIQMQCYAVMKLILKEFINPHCSPHCRVLCSYFIKTFLFWEYEEIDPSYWHKNNFRNCIMRLLSDFCECIRLGSLMHYFIQSFNLLSVKMTDEIQMELLRIFDIILQSDIAVLKECKTLNKVWFECINRETGTIDGAGTAKRNLLKNDECMMATIQNLQAGVLKLHKRDFVSLFTLTSKFIYHFHMQHALHKTDLIRLTMIFLLSDARFSLTYMMLQRVGNTTLYKPRRFLQSNVSGIDISTCRLWYAMLMTKCGDYHLSLRIVNKVLSSISPFALYYTGCSLRHLSDETKERYEDMCSSIDTRITERARKAWMFDLRIMPLNMDMTPAAIQVELIHCDEEFGVYLSPFVCAYYLMFLNYYGLRQYDNRDRALRQLVDVVNDPEQHGLHRWHSFNIAGNCLLSVGETEQARNMFMRSLEDTYTLSLPAVHRHNSAQYYIQCLSR